MPVCSHASYFKRRLSAITVAPAHYCGMLRNRAITVGVGGGGDRLNGVWGSSVMIFLLALFIVNQYHIISYMLNQNLLYCHWF